MKEALHEALSKAQIQIGQIDGAGFGIAGFDWHSEESKMKEVISSIGVRAPFKMVNDVVLGLLAGTSEGWGIAVVSGRAATAAAGIANTNAKDVSPDTASPWAKARVVVN